MSTPFTEEEILLQLDTCSNKYYRPTIDDFYCYPVTARLNCYRDGTRWAIIFETFSYSVRQGGHFGGNNVLHIFGNCVSGEQGEVDESESVNRFGTNPKII